jgi:hypothetical protein
VTGLHFYFRFAISVSIDLFFGVVFNVSSNFFRGIGLIDGFVTFGRGRVIRAGGFGIGGGFEFFGFTGFIGRG